MQRLVGTFAPYRWPILQIVLGLIVTTLLGLAEPFLVRFIVDDAIGRGDAGLLVVFAAALIALPFVGGTIGVTVRYLSNRVGQSIVRDLRRALYAQLQRLSLRFFTQTRAGEIQSRLSNDIGGVEEFASATAPTVVLNVVAVLGTLAAMLLLSPLLTLVSLAILPVFLWLTVRVGRVRRRTSDETQESLARLASISQETLSVSGILLTKLHGRSRFAQARFDAENERLTELQVRQRMVGRWLFMLTDALFAATPAVVYLVGGLQLIGSGTARGGAEVTLGGMIAFTLLQARLFYPVEDLLHVHVELQGALALFDRIFEYLDLPVEIADAPDAIRLSPHHVRGWLTFDHVSFAYEPREPGARSPRGRPTSQRLLGEDAGALHDVSFEVRPGSLAALVGPSGAGKTTVAYLATRLYEADSGEIAIDGRDIRTITLDSLSELIGVVTQETYLFHDTVRENLRYGRLDATDGELVAAARAAAIHDRIVEQPEGYDTVVGERGFKLSTGEKQRLAIARVILRDPRILILDEATSALDTHSERLVQGALANLMEGRTTLAIAHRLSTILAADLILVMDGGRIVERGRHEELLARHGLYARLYEEQFAGRPTARVAVPVIS